MSEDMDAEAENGEYDVSDSDNSSEYDDALEEITRVKTDAESQNGENNRANSQNCSEYEDVFDENTLVKTTADGTDEESTSSEDDIGGGARNFTSNIKECFIDTEFTSSDDDIGGVAWKKTSKKGKIINIRNCSNIQVGKTNKQQLERLDGIEERFTALQQTINTQQETITEQTKAIQILQEADTEKKQAIQILQETNTQQKQAIQILQEADTQQKQAIQILQEADTEQKKTTQERQQMIHILQDKVTGQQESIRKSNVENKKTISGLQHSVNIQQEEIQSLKMKFKPNNSIESSPLTNVTNQSKDVKLSSDNLNEEVLSDETTPQNKTEEQLLEEWYQRLLRDKGYISASELLRYLVNMRRLKNMLDRGDISEEEFQRSLEEWRIMENMRLQQQQKKRFTPSTK